MVNVNFGVDTRRLCGSRKFQATEHSKLRPNAIFLSLLKKDLKANDEGVKCLGSHGKVISESK